MLSVISSLPAASTCHPAVQKLGDLYDSVDSVQSFTKLVLQSGKSAVRLYCTVPTWSSSSDTCLDLHDLHELQSRFLLLIHDLLQSLRSSGVVASYSLAPSNSPLCLVCALPPGSGTSQVTASAVSMLKNTDTKKRGNVLLGQLEHGPCLVIT